MQFKAVIDRFEGTMAVLLVGSEEKRVHWPKSLLSGTEREGDILNISFTVDTEATRCAKEEAESLLARILSEQKRGQ